ncbi:MAG: tripartite tricarboxylate transporter TctB family protein [Alphaproteobacteria bacterium]
MRADLPSGLIWLAAGIWVAWEGWDLGLGTANDPGSGFVLFWCGLLLAVLAAAQIVGALGAAGGPPLGAVLGGIGWRRPAIALAALAAYATVLIPLGFILATAGFILVLLLAIEPMRLPAALALSAGTATAVWVVFVRLLGVPLPRGLLAF